MTFPDLLDVRALRGPNVQGRYAALQARLGPFTPLVSVSANYSHNLNQLIPASMLRAETALDSLEDWMLTGRESHVAAAIAQLTLAIEIACTCKVSLCHITRASAADPCVLGVEIESIEDQDIARQCLVAAHAVCRAAVEGTAYDFWC